MWLRRLKLDSVNLLVILYNYTSISLHCQWGVENNVEIFTNRLIHGPLRINNHRLTSTKFTACYIMSSTITFFWSTLLIIHSWDTWQGSPSIMQVLFQIFWYYHTLSVHVVLVIQYTALLTSLPKHESGHILSNPLHPPLSTVYLFGKY